MNTKPLPMLASMLFLAACAQSETLPRASTPVQPTEATRPTTPQFVSQEPLGAANALQAEIIRGKGTGLREIARRDRGAREIDGQITLKFEDTELREFAKAVLGDILQLDYELDPKLQGTVTLETAHPIPKDAVLPTVESALRLSGIVLVQRGNRYLLTTSADAPRHAPIGLRSGPLAPGFHVVILPLTYVSAAEIRQAVEPIVPQGAILRTDPVRNLVFLAGTEDELLNLEETIEMFDVDWLANQSFGIFPLHAAPAKAVAHELSVVIGNNGPMSGVVRIEALDRMNAILVVSPRAAYLEELRGWIERFDRSGGVGGDSRIFVYTAENGRAADLARVLGRLLGIAGTNTGPTAGPQTQQATTGALSGMGSGQGLADASSPAAMMSGAAAQNDDAAGAGDEKNGGAVAAMRGVRITADEAKNSLLILATRQQYEIIEAALHQLDGVPLQVLLEAAIAEVTLTNDLQYGVQWYFKSGKTQTLQANSAPNNIGLTTGGLSFLFSHGTDITAVLDLLSNLTQVQVISAPEVMVLNNHAALMQVGDEVPISTSSAISVQTPGAPLVNTIQLQNTGIILRVTPRVNQGGMVTMDVSQEVSSSVPTTTSNIDSPTIQQRLIATSVAVHDGQTIALGGLISDSRTRSSSGIPWLKDIPAIGALFGTSDDQIKRTELIVLITPHVVRDREEAHRVTDEVRAKLPMTRVLDGRAAAPREQ